MDDPCRQCDNLEGRDAFLAGHFDRLSELKNPSGALQQALAMHRESEQKYKHLIDCAPDAIFIADAETGIILDANHQAGELLGVPVEQIIGMHQRQLHPGDEADKYRQLFASHIASGGVGLDKDVSVCRNDGQKIPVQINATVTQIGDKKVIYGIFRDMTEQQQLLREILNSQDRFKRLADASFEAIAIHQDGKLLDVNQQYLEMFGYTFEELHTKNGLDMIAPASRQIVTDRIEAGYEGAYEVTGLRKDGSLFPIEIRVRLSSIDRRPVRIGVIRDLSDEKHLKQQLATSEEKYRRLYNNAQVALFITDLNGLLLDCNYKTLELFGYSRDEKEENYLNKVYVTDYYVDKKRRNQFLFDLQTYGQVKHFEAELKRTDGTRFWVSIWATLSPEAGHIEGALYDITVSKVLTTTEKRVLRIILEGKSNKEIADALNRSVRTIEDHRAHLMQKLNVHNLVELVQMAQSCQFDLQNNGKPSV